MNCVKCGAALEEGSTSTLCPACLALEIPPQEEKTPDPAPSAEAPIDPAPPVVETAPPAETPPTENTIETTEPTENAPDEGGAPGVPL